MQQEWKAEATGRLDAFLSERSSLSRSRLRRAIDDGHVRINGTTATKPAQRVHAGDDVLLLLDDLPTEGAQIAAADLALPVLYEDAVCMVLAKPAGISVHPGAGMPEDEATILHGIAHVFAERNIPFSTETALVHRLDKDTTGCLLVAKTAAAHRALQEQFAKRTTEKTYLTIVAGTPVPPAAMIDAPVGRNLTSRTKMSVLKTATSRDAKTTYRTLATGAGAALLACDLHTGRTHQIRVHLTSIGHPILGDRTYASSASKRLSEELKADTLCLHAWTLSFTSPADSARKTVTMPPPAAFTGVLERCGMPQPTAA
jgi:23S rRNA pseudouridine1911/1915/1917 synthase